MRGILLRMITVTEMKLFEWVLIGLASAGLIAALITVARVWRKK